jgi:GT2 family glycosyltransferase
VRDCPALGGNRRPPIWISVIISNLNGRRFLDRLLDSLRIQAGVVLQIIVVDRASVDGSLEFLAAQLDVTVLHEPPETGLVSGYSRGVVAAVHDFLFFCNEDMWFSPDCLRLLAERIDVSTGVIASDPWQWTYDQSILIHAGTRFRVARWSFLSPFPFRKNSFTEPVLAGDVVPFACAGAFLIHRPSYDATGGWDRLFFLDHEDVDLFIRVWQLGWRCVSVPEAKVFHAVGASNNQQISTTNTPVRRRRFISSTASVAVIGAKYFTSMALLFPFLHLLISVAKELLRLHPNRTYLSILAVAEFMRRLRPALHFRARWRTHNRARPGQLFYTAPEFNFPPGS